MPPPRLTMITGARPVSVPSARGHRDDGHHQPVPVGGSDVDRMLELVRVTQVDLAGRAAGLLSAREIDRLRWRVDELARPTTSPAHWLALRKQLRLDQYALVMTRYEFLILNQMWDWRLRLTRSLAVSLDAHPRELTPDADETYHRILDVAHDRDGARSVTDASLTIAHTHLCVIGRPERVTSVVDNVQT